MRIIANRISSLGFWEVRMVYLTVDYCNGRFGVFNMKNNEMSINIKMMAYKFKNNVGNYYKG